MPINPFIGMLSGNPVGAGMQTYNQMLDIQGQAALGRGIQDMFNPGVPQGIPQGGGPFSGITQPFQRLGQGLGQVFGLGGPPGQPAPTSAPMGFPSGAGGQQSAPLGPGPQMSVAPQQPGPPPPPPQSPQQATGVPTGAGAVIGQMSYNDLLSHIVRANPGASPAVIGHALQKAVPFMNAQALAQWRADQSARGWTGLSIREGQAETQAATAQARTATQSLSVQERIITGQIKTWENLRDTNQVNADEANRQIAQLQAQRDALLRGQGGGGGGPRPTEPAPTSTADPRSTLTPDQLRTVKPLPPTPQAPSFSDRFTGGPAQQPQQPPSIISGPAPPTTAPAAPATAEAPTTLPANEPQTVAGKAHPSLVDSIGQYNQQPLNEGLSGARGNANKQIMDDVRRKYPGYDASVFKTRQAGEIEFVRGMAARQVRASNVAVAHIGQLRQLAEALKTGSPQIINQARLAYQKQMGKPAPVGFDAMRQILGAEIIKAIVPGGGGVTERQAVEQKLSGANSPEQFVEIFNDLTRGLGKQVAGLKKSYEAGGGKRDFDKTFLEPETVKALKAVEGTGAGETGAGGKPQTVQQGGHTYTLQPDGSYQ